MADIIREKLLIGTVGFHHPYLVFLISAFDVIYDMFTVTIISCIFRSVFTVFIVVDNDVSSLKVGIITDMVNSIVLMADGAKAFQ